MAVQVTPDSSSALLAARSAQKAAAARQADSLQSTAGGRPRGADSVQLNSSATTSKVQEAHRTLAQAQRGMGALGVANHSLSEASKHLGFVQSVVASGKSGPEARLAVADGLANLDQAVRGAKFEGRNVLDGTDFSVATSASSVKVGVGSQDLQDLASLLASGGRGISALNLERPAASAKALEQASNLIAGTMQEVTSQAGNLNGLLGELGAELDGVAPATLSGSDATGAASASAAAIAAAPTAAMSSQATVSATTVARLLAD